MQVDILVLASVLAIGGMFYAIINCMIGATINLMNSRNFDVIVLYGFVIMPHNNIHY